MIFIVVFVEIFSTKAFPDCPYSGHRWPFEGAYFTIGFTIPSSWISEISAASVKWDSPCFQLNAQPGGSNTIKLADLGYVGSAGYLSVTAVTYYEISGYIKNCSSQINNNASVNWSTNGSPSSSEFDVQSVMLHEFGHWLSLNDVSGSSSTMGYIWRGALKRDLSLDVQGCSSEIYCNPTPVCENCPPAVPSNFLAKIVGKDVILTWDVVDQASTWGFKLYKNGQITTLSTSTTSYADLGATGLLPIEYKIGAFNQYGESISNPINVVRSPNTIGQNTFWSDVVFVNSNVTVNSGIELNITPNSKIFIDAGHNYWINVYGSLVIQGTQDRMVTFTSNAVSPIPGDWYGIKLSGGPNNLQYCDIRYAQYGVYVNNTSTNLIENCNITGCMTYGLYAYNTSMISNTVAVKNCTINNNSNYGIGLNTARVDLSQNNLAFGVMNNSGNGIVVEIGGKIYLDGVYVTGNANYGVYVNGTTAYATFSRDGIAKGNNHVENNRSGQVFIYSGGTYLGERLIHYNCVCDEYRPVVKSTVTNLLAIPCAPPCYLVQSIDDHAGYNYLSGQYYWIRNSTGSTVKAQLNYWSQPIVCPPPSTAFSGLVNYANCLTSGSSSAGIVSGINEGESFGNQTFIATSSDLVVFETDSSLFLNWIEDLEQKIQNGSSDAQDALHLLSSLVGPGCRFPDALGVPWETFLAGVVASASSTSLKSLAKAYLIQSKIDQKDFDGAILLANSILRESPEDELWFHCQVEIIYALVAKGDLSTAEELFNHTRRRGAIINPQAVIFLREFLEMVKIFGIDASRPIATQPQETVSEVHGILHESFWLNQNYPNPFNPTTNLTYHLPVNEHVTVKVYDILGRELVTLVDEFKFAGIHSIKFDGSDLSSGVYFYKFQAGKYYRTGKMLLAK